MPCLVPQREAQPDPRTTLVSRNVTVAGHRTSLRLEPAMWEALQEVCIREQSSASALVTEIASGPAASSLTSAVRLYLLAYFRAAASEDGHRAAGHGVVPRRYLMRIVPSMKGAH
jgi:predicted DNA-binding ribbon-helix-helix protein